MKKRWLQWITIHFSLLGQTYVLDVHPFNPRIAMSAGYDGKTIVWDVSIWFIKPFLSSFI